jgi:uncharacterized membrane protein YuzA (DUF378 family)
MKIIHVVAFILLVVGGLNWLLVGLIGWDVGELFGGQAAVVSRIVYILVGLSGVWLAISHKKDCKGCEASAPAAPQM